MKTINKILGLILIATVALVSCTRDYDAPPREPMYDGPEENITIKEIKDKFSDIIFNPSHRGVERIDTEYIINARVISSDTEGNVYKQIYVEDETGGLNIQIDGTNISTLYPKGQEVYINLHGLYVGQYNGVIQLGGGKEPDRSNASKDRTTRVDFADFKKKASKVGWPNLKQVKAHKIKLSDLSTEGDELLSTLVELKNVKFEGAGKLTFSDFQVNTDRNLKDKENKSITVRTSGYASFQAKLLPTGRGRVTAILSKYNAEWQLIINSIEDVGPFIEEEDDDKEEGGNTSGVLYSETFGKVSKVDNKWPFLSDYKDFDNKDVKYSDSKGTVSVRAQGGATYIWLPAKSDEEFKIEGLKLSEGNPKSLTLTYDAMPNLYDAGSKSNINSVAVIYNGNELKVPDTPMENPTDNNVVKTITITGLAPSANATLVFVSKGEKNETGMRIGNVKIVTGTDNPTTPTEPGKPTDPEKPTDPVKPVEPQDGVLYKETFATGTKDYSKNNRPKIADFKDQDAKGVTYSDPTGLADIRSHLKVNYVWLPSGKDSEFTISGLKLSSGNDLVLSYDIMPNLYNDDEAGDIAAIEVYVNDKKQTVNSQILTAPADKNKVIRVNITGIPAEDNVVVSFKGLAATNQRGYRIGNIEIASKK